MGEDTDTQGTEDQNWSSEDAEVENRRKSSDKIVTSGLVLSDESSSEDDRDEADITNQEGRTNLGPSDIQRLSAELQRTMEAEKQRKLTFLRQLEEKQAPKDEQKINKSGPAEPTKYQGQTSHEEEQRIIAETAEKQRLAVEASEEQRRIAEAVEVQKK